MKLQRTPNRWSCLLASFAMVLDLPMTGLAFEIGHDGSMILWPDLEEPYRRRSFHLQEMIDCCLKRGFAVTQIEAIPQSVPMGMEAFPVLITRNCEERFANYLTVPGVLLGAGRSGVPHAVAYDGDGRIYDPAGSIYRLDADCPFMIREFLRVDAIQSVSKIRNEFVLT